MTALQIAYGVVAFWAVVAVFIVWANWMKRRHARALEDALEEEFDDHTGCS